MNQARQFHQAGDLVLAEQLYRQVLQADPDCAEAWTWLGLACRQLNRPDEAIAHYRQAIRLRPGSAMPFINLANLLSGQGNLEAAVDCLRDCLLQMPSFPLAHYHLANLLYAQGKLEEATAHFQEAVHLEPSFADAHANLGSTLLTLGRVDEAVAHFRQALHHKPHTVRALFNLAANGFYTAAEPGIDQLRAWIADPQLSPDSRLQLHFTLGYLLDQAGECAEAFEHFSQGNALRRDLSRQSGETFDPVEHSRWIDRLIAAFSPEYSRRVRDFGFESELPVFIVGMPRSGTTLVEQILSQHPKVLGAGELEDMSTIVADLPARLLPLVSAEVGEFPSRDQADRDYPECLARLDVATTRAISGAHLARLARLGSPVERITDKMPANFLHLGLIATLFPRARVIHCRRDPRDVCLSCFFQLLHLAYTWDLGDLGRYYRDYERLMAHWRTVLPLQMLDVVYEDLVANQEAVSRRLVDFCGLPWDERCLRFHENRRPIENVSRVQVRQPMYTTSVGRWRRYAAQLGPLLHALGDSAEAASGIAHSAG